MAERRDYSDVAWPWDGDPNWAQPREGATYDPGHDENWRLACSECDLHFPAEIDMGVIGDHWAGHFPSWSFESQEPQMQLNLVWVGLGTPPASGRKAWIPL